jgi:hypothetical protein
MRKSFVFSFINANRNNANRITKNNDCVSFSFISTTFQCLCQLQYNFCFVFHLFLGSLSKRFHTPTAFETTQQTLLEIGGCVAIKSVSSTTMIYNIQWHIYIYIYIYIYTNIYTHTQYIQTYTHILTQDHWMMSLCGAKPSLSMSSPNSTGTRPPKCTFAAPRLALQARSRRTCAQVCIN